MPAAPHPDFKAVAKSLGALCDRHGVGWGEVIDFLKALDEREVLARDRSIADDYLAGVPRKVICARHGVTEYGLRQALERAGVQSNRMARQAERERRLIELWNAGASHREIALATGMAEGGVKAMRHRLGLEPRR